MSLELRSRIREAVSSYDVRTMLPKTLMIFLFKMSDGLCA
jgi:hypothetical protein